MTGLQPRLVLAGDSSHRVGQIVFCDGWLAAEVLSQHLMSNVRHRRSLFNAIAAAHFLSVGEGSRYRFKTLGDYLFSIDGVPVSENFADSYVERSTRLPRLGRVPLAR